MNILFLHVYSEYNAGDTAIVSVMLHEYRTRYPDCSIKLSSVTKQNMPSFKKAPYVSSFFCEAIYASQKPLYRLINTFWMFFTTGIFLFIFKVFHRQWFFLLSKPLQHFVRAVLQADLVIGVGGGYIIGKGYWQSTVSLLITLYEFWFAVKLNKRVQLYSQSIGPFERPLQRVIAANVLNQVEQITVREGISKQLLRDMRITRPAIKSALDAAFFYLPKTKNRMRNTLIASGISFKKPVLGITVKQCSHNVLVQQQYETSIIAAAVCAVETCGMQVVFIPHVTATVQNDDDRDVQKHIHSHLKSKQDIIFLENRFQTDELKGIYENLSYLIGTRLHSAIFAITGNVPCIHIAYEPKGLGIMKQLNLEKWVVMVEEITPELLIQTFIQLQYAKDLYKGIASTN